MDNFNTHIGASLYKTFNPKEARRILDKLDFHYTPIHGSWLNMAEIEFSILGRECLDRRIPDKTALINEVNAWTEERNSKESKIIWRFKNEDARIKLKRLYPLIKELLSKVVFELKIKRQSGFQESPRFHQRIVHLQSPLPGNQSHVTFSNSFLHIVPA